MKNAKSLSISDIEPDDVLLKLTEEKGMEILNKLN